MTTQHTRKSSKQYQLLTSSNKINDMLKSDKNRHFSTEIRHLTIHDEEDEENINDKSECESLEKESPVPRPTWSEFSIATPTTPSKMSLSRSYKFVQLEHALQSANLLKNFDEQKTFQQDYLRSLHENKFEQFLRMSYNKLSNHNESLKREQRLKRSRKFMFVDLEKNFLDQDPTRDLKLVFIDDQSTRLTDNHLKMFANRNSAASTQSNDAAIEAFYENNLHRLLKDPSRARDEIILFARHTGEKLQERLPHLPRVPHRIKIVDERDIKRTFDKRTLIQMKHKRALASVEKRRQMASQMISQSQKNQRRMDRINSRKPLIMKNSTCCRDLLDQVVEIEHVLKRELIDNEKNIDSSERIQSKTTNYSSSQMTATTITNDETLSASYSSCSIPYQDPISIHPIKKSNHIQIKQCTRPFTAPDRKLEWSSYY